RAARGAGQPELFESEDRRSHRERFVLRKGTVPTWDRTVPMLLSVVVATYNRLGLLLELLTDLAGQRLPAGSFEVIVVDDGSKVPVRPRILERSWPFSIQVVERPNGGQALARHQGITHAKGDIVVITDDDMALHEDFLAAHR